MAQTSDLRKRHSRSCKTGKDAGCNCKPSWQARVWIPEEGKRRTQTFPTRAAAVGWLTDARKAAKDGKLKFGDSKITVSAWLDRWLSERAPQNASDDLVELYRKNLEKHVKPDIGTGRLVNLRRADCNALVGELFEKGLARNTIKNVLTPLRLALDWAVDEEKIAGNPAAGLDIPKKAPTRKLHVPTRAEVGAIALRTDRDGREAILLAASLGLRRGELLALRWCDVDLKRNVVHVRRQNINGQIRDNTKTDAGERMVPLFAKARRRLEARVRRLGLQPQWLGQDERLVFANRNGGPIHPRNWTRRVWEPAREAAGLPDVRVHDLRHFAASALREQGMDNKLRSAVVGHADEKVTDTIYTHLRREHIEAAATAYDPLGR